MRRIERRREVLEKLCRFVRLLRRRFAKLTLILYGSYARGDFNAWSDVDVILVWEGFGSKRLPERYELLRDTLYMIDEPLELIPWTPREARIMLEKSTWRKALQDCMVLADDYGICVGLCKLVKCDGEERREPQNGRSRSPAASGSRGRGEGATG